MLYDLGAHNYDPATGQFLARDPWVSITQSPHAYAGGNPLNFMDPNGKAYDPNCSGAALCSGLRNPDYSFTTFSIGIGLFSLTDTQIYDKAGNCYEELSPTVGPGLPLAGAHGWGWIGGPTAQEPDETTVQNFITGLGACGGMTIGGGSSGCAGGPGLPAQYGFSIQESVGLDPVSISPSWGWAEPNLNEPPISINENWASNRSSHSA